MGYSKSISQHFLHAALRLSQKRIPFLHEVIPIIDILTEKLEDAIYDSSLHPAVRVGAKKGLAILNKYYLKTDESIMYRIAMSEYHSSEFSSSSNVVISSSQSEVQTYLSFCKEMAAGVD